MEFKVMTVTPELAKEWLTKNIENNRNKSRSKIDAYAKDMRAGRWQLNGEAIRFNQSGKLVDGQNRLSAVIQAGVPVEMCVIIGVSDEVNIYDCGWLRRPEHVLQMKGVYANHRHFAAARVLFGLISERVSVGEVTQFVEENIEALSDAMALSAKRYNNDRILQRANITAAAWVFIVNGYDRGAIDRFFDIATSGFYTDNKETAAIAFRNYVIGGKSQVWLSKRYRMTDFDACCKAFTDFVGGKPRKKPYNEKDFEKCNIFHGSSAEAILMQYTNGKSKESQDEDKPDEDDRIKPEDRRAGSILRMARIAKGWSVPELAKYTGFDVATILNFETGAYHISENANNSFKYALGCDIKSEVAAS